MDAEEDNIVLKDNLGIPMRPLKNTVVLATSFLCTYTAYQGIQNIQSSINQSGGLGVASLACIYTSLILTGILAPLYLRLVGLKTTFILGFASQCVYTFSNFYPEWLTLIPSSILLGLAVSPMWIGRNLYVNTMAKYSSETNSSNLHGSLSRFNGIFFSLFGFAQVAGSFISSAVLYQSSTDQSDLNQTRICGADDCPGSVNHTTVIVRPDKKVINILMGIYLGCGLLGLGATVIFLRPLEFDKSDRSRSLYKMVACCSVLRELKLLALIPLILSQGITSSILLTGYTKAFVSCTVGVKMVGYVMMCYGIVSSAAAAGFGHIAKYTGRYPLIGTTLTLDIVALVTLLLWKPTPEGYIWLFVVPSVWALGEGIWASQVFSLVALAFPRKQTAVFSTTHTCHALAFTFVLVSDNYLCLRTKFYIAVSVWTLGAIGYILVEIMVARDNTPPAVFYRAVGLDEDDDDEDVVQFDILRDGKAGT